MHSIFALTAGKSDIIYICVCIYKSDFSSDGQYIWALSEKKVAHDTVMHTMSISLRVAGNIQQVYKSKFVGCQNKVHLYAG